MACLLCRQPAQVFGTVVFNLAAMCKLVKRRSAEASDGMHSFYNGSSEVWSPSSRCG